MSKGTVKYFNDLKGWGIISSADSPEDIYVHYTSINMNGFKTLRQGQEVLFDLIHSNGRPLAQNVLPSR
ncbi:MAG TPA: cold shock domain-containing protein [candidate division Zixibacteria bacterium]|nr:cold shock domain-containing protein [candidate division Zixibacteria bacterium]MDD4917101.1 cold shock domain-containing protein [candidate division Zixibacteria bacterium]MDM7972715.1 cold shock domain-containing protein [candidate division Zixibacteria bacterium]HOD65327.1 cold shock domain-containing protein [candidate division Zixibacteria bacterium]HOZ08044.1 cold shock domain-containing protein [candidate division Zixibacteria bacterium]